MKKYIFLLLLFPSLGNAQNFVDILTIGYGQSFNNDFEGTPSSTEVKSIEADLTYPVVLNDNNTLITGVLFGKNNLQLFPEDEFKNLYSTTLKLGLSSTYSDKWSSTVVLLPKIASDYEDISGEDFYLGGIALLKLQKSENLQYKFGFYGSTEAFGFFTTPIFGWTYNSPNGKFRMDTSLPISADLNYTQGSLTYGFDYMGIGRSFRTTSNNQDVYADLSNLEFATYVQLNLVENTILLRGKLGYASNNYEVYADGEKIDLGVAAFSFGDDRTQLNPVINGGLFAKFEVVYRFNIPEKE